MSRTLPSLNPWPAGKPLPEGAITLFYDPATNQEYRVDLTRLGDTPPPAELSLAQLQALLVAGDGITITPTKEGKLLISSTVVAAVPKAPAAPTTGQVDDTADTFSFLANPAYPAAAQYKVVGRPGVTGAEQLDATNSYVSGGRIYLKVVGAVSKGGLAVYVAGSGSVPDGQALTNSEAFTGAVVTPGDTLAPNISLTVPTAGATLTLGQPVQLTANATDNVGVTGMVFTNGATGAVLGTGAKNGNSYSVAYTPTTAGALTITATASDAAGNSQGASVTVNVQAATNQPPSVTINGSSSATVGTSQNYQSVASDSDGVVALVELLLMADASTLTSYSVLGSDNSSPYVVGWTPSAAGTSYLRMRATDDKGAQSFSSVLSVSVQAGASKPKKLVYMGDSLVNTVLTTTSRATARLNSSALETAVISHPGEGAREWLNGHLSESAAAVDSAKDCYALVSEDTNGLNQYYIDQVKADALALANALLQQGYKGIVWMQVAACKSPYAYARDAQGNIIGSSVAEKQAGFDSARKAYNAYLQTLVGSKLYAVGDLSVYPNVYNQVNATDSRYFYPAKQGPYGNGEPGNVHYTDYGARYWGEAAAQAAAPMLGIALNPATITIPDAPDPGSGGGSGDPTYVSSPQTLDYVAANSNTAYVNGVFTKVAGGQGWNAAGLSRQAVDFTKYAVGQKLIIEYDEPGRNAGGIFGTVEAAAYNANPVDIYKGTLCFYYDLNEYAVWTNGFAFGTTARLSGKPRIEVTRGQTQDTVNFYVGTKPDPVYVVTGRITTPIQFATYLGNDSTGADGASTTPACVITGEKIYIA